MMKSFRIKNLRSIEDSGDIQIRPINILVGKNSAGKSTIARSLPLLRQSIESATKGPILWYGRLVDFGDFRNATCSTFPHRPISLSFIMDLSGRPRKTRRSNNSPIFSPMSDQAEFYGPLQNVRLSILIGAGDQATAGELRKVQLDFGSDEVCIDLAGDIIKAVSVSGVAVDLGPGKSWFSDKGKILPLLGVARTETVEKDNQKHEFLVQEITPFRKELFDAVSPFFHGNTGTEKIAAFVLGLQYADEKHFYEQLRATSYATTYLNTNVSLRKPGNRDIRKIRHLVLLANLSRILLRIDNEIAAFGRSVRYVEPVRAIAERYYRLQDLAIDEIDSRGGNAAIYLASLDNEAKQALSHWMSSNFGFHVYVEHGSGHVQVKVASNDNGGKNIADLGFGYSQLLPIILQIWDSTKRGQQRSPNQTDRPLLVIEQPELHLHPQYQAKIADVIASAMNAKDNMTSGVFIETHSEHLINRLGQLIGDGKIFGADVQILIVEQSKSGTSTVKRAEFNQNGFLDSNWPSGFFVPEHMG